MLLAWMVSWMNIRQQRAKSISTTYKNDQPYKLKTSSLLCKKQELVKGQLEKGWVNFSYSYSKKVCFKNFPTLSSTVPAPFVLMPTQFSHC